MQKKKVLFVGSFVEKAKDGSVGGQMYACKSLIASSLSEEVEWILLDTTGVSVPPPPLYIRLWFALFRILKFIWLLLYKRPDTTLIFSANGPSVYEKGSMVLIARLFGTKTLLALRGGPLVNEIKQNSNLRRFLILVLSKSDYVICQGIFWKEFFEKLIGFQNEKFLVIPNWMDLNNYIYHPTKPYNGCITLLFMGWLQEDKGVFDIIEAVRQPFSKPIHLVFMGDGGARQGLVNIATSLPKSCKVSFTGWLHGKDKMEYLYKADIFILPSYAEGMPNSLMEAMASGVAGIATNVGAVEELIVNEETGMLIQVKDPVGLRLVLGKLIDNIDLRRHIVVQARKKIETNHSLESAVEKLKQII